MIRRRHALLTLASALMILSAPAPASASHLESEEHYDPIECHSGTRIPVPVRGDVGLFTGKAGCIGGDPGHINYSVSRASDVQAKGIVTELKDEYTGESDLAYSALRPGHDQVIVTASDGKSSDTATINLENVFAEKGTALARPALEQIPSKKGVVRLAGAACPSFSFPGVGSCKHTATATATIRERGKPKRTVRIAKVSLTVAPPDQDEDVLSKPLNAKLAEKFLRVLKQARQMKVTIVHKVEQRDPFGYWNDERTDKVTLYSRT